MRALHDAVSIGNIEEVKRLIKDGADINTIDDDGDTLLHSAVRKGNLEMMKVLIELGANINAEGQRGYTPLHHAAGTGDLEGLKLLIEKCADVNIKDKNGYTPLHLAAYNQNTSMSEFLIERGADVNAKDNFDSTPLHSAMRVANVRGELGQLKLLIKKGADINVQDNSGNTFLHLIAKYGYAHKDGYAKFTDDVLECLIMHGANVNAKDYSGSTPLHHAASTGHEKTVEFFIEHCANAYVRNNNGEKAIDLAKSHGHKKITKLLEHGVEKSCSTKLLFDEVKKCSTEVAESLIKDGANVKANDDHGYTPLHWAVEKKCKELAKLLIDNDAEVNARDNKGYTPLKIAVQGGNNELAELLIDSGANVNAKDDYGWKVLHWARDVGIVDLLIRHDADVNARDNNGNTLLHWAAKNGHTGVVELLIGKGADVVKNNNSKMPSELAKNEPIREKLKNYEEGQPSEQEKIKAALEKDLKEAEEKLKEATDEKTTALGKLLKLEKDMRDLQKEQPVVEKVLSDVKEEFNKCNLAQKLDTITNKLQEIDSELTPSYYAYSSAPSAAGQSRFENVINNILSNAELLNDSKMKSNIVTTVGEMLDMLKKCGSQSEEKLFSITDKIDEIKANWSSGTEDLDKGVIPSPSANDILYSENSGNSNFQLNW